MLPIREAAAASLVAALLLGAAGGLGGCKSTPSSQTDAGADADAGAGADLAIADADVEAADARCNSLTQLGAPVTPICDPGSAPAATGGAITDGTYVLTETHFHGGCSTQPLAETIVVSQATVQSIATGADGGEIRTSVSFLQDNLGTRLMEIQSCPARVQTTVRFTATPTTLTIYLSTVLATRVSTFTLR